MNTTIDHNLDLEKLLSDRNYFSEIYSDICEGEIDYETLTDKEQSIIDKGYEKHMKDIVSPFLSKEPLEPADHLPDPPKNGLVGIFESIVKILS